MNNQSDKDSLHLRSLMSFDDWLFCKIPRQLFCRKIWFDDVAIKFKQIHAILILKEEVTEKKNENWDKFQRTRWTNS